MTDLLLTTFHERHWDNRRRWRSWGSGDDEHRFTIPTDRLWSRFELRVTEQVGLWSDASIASFQASGSPGEYIVKVHWYYALFGSVEYYLDVYVKTPAEAPVINASSYMLMTIIMRPGLVTAGDTSTGYVQLPSAQATDTVVSLSLGGAPATLSTSSVTIPAGSLRSPSFSVVTSPRPSRSPGGSGASLVMYTYEEVTVWGRAVLGGVPALGKGTITTIG